MAICKETDFARMVGMEVIETLQVINPRLYAGVIKKLKA